MPTRNSFVDETHAVGKPEYSNVLKDILSKGVCPFCPENFSWHKKPILGKDKDWFVTENSWPYKNARYHFLLICTAHKTDVDELTIDDFVSLHNLVRGIRERFEISGGAMTLRFGDSRFTGATVAHLHFHLIVPSLYKSGKKKGRARIVWFPVG